MERFLIQKTLTGTKTLILLSWFNKQSPSPPQPPALLPTYPFLHHGPAPDVVVARACHSGCAIHPSNRITNPDNAEANCSRCPSKRITDPDHAETLSSTMHKHKAFSGTAERHCVKPKVAINHEGSTNSDSHENADYEHGVESIMLPLVMICSQS